MLFKKSNAVSVGNSLNWKITKKLLDLITRDNNHLDTKKVIALINKGADIYRYPVTNQTILHPLFAHKCFNLKILNAILHKEKNLNIYVADNYGQCALTYYLAFNSNCNGEIIKRLVDGKKISVNEKNCGGLTPLQYYLKNANEIKTDVVEVFLNAENIDIQVKDECDNNLLHYLCNAESINVKPLQLLIDKGLNLNEKNKNGQTVLHVLYPGDYYGNVECLDGVLNLLPFFINQDIDINASDNNGNTLLHNICELFSAKRTCYLNYSGTALPILVKLANAISILIQNKADHAIFNSGGVTPLQRLLFDGVTSGRPALEKQDAVDQLITSIIVEVMRNSNKHTSSLEIFSGMHYFENILMTLQRPALFKKFGELSNFGNYKCRIYGAAKSQAFATLGSIMLWQRKNKKRVQKSLQYQIVDQAFAPKSIILKNEKGEELATVNIDPRVVIRESEQEKGERQENQFVMV